MAKKILFILIFLSFYSLNAQENKIPEFRGVWVTTVKMLDYPSRRNLSSDQLKKEYLRIIDSCKAIGANAIIFQIRPAADAFYNSPYELWSEWLTGKQGRQPEPYFDPLEFMIKETHKRNMEFHAWINPYRAIATISKADIAPNHITRTKPEWFFNYGVNKYFNPGIPEVRQYIVKIISDIVKRYNIDGIHFDDYFYPYPIRNDENKIIQIPDFNTYKKYGAGFSDIKNWRRNNVNMLVMEVHDSIKAIKPNVKFGISPPGVWRNKGYDPKGSATLGLAAYDWIFADVLLWLQEGWVDYIAPQLYWEIGHSHADFKVLVEWWNNNSYDVDLYIGLNIHGIDPTRKKKIWGNPNQIPNQINLANSYPAVKGFILFRYQSLAKNPLGIKDSLRNKYFKVDSSQIILVQNDVDTNNTNIVSVDTDVINIVDTNIVSVDTDVTNIVDTNITNITKIDTIPPSTPTNMGKYRVGTEITIYWDNVSSEDLAHYVVYVFEGKKIPEQLNLSNKYKVVSENFVRFDRDKKIKIFGKKYAFVVTAVDNAANESKPGKPIYIKL